MEQEYNEIKQLAKKNKNKHLDKRLQVIILRYEGLKYDEIDSKLGYTSSLGKSALRPIQKTKNQ